MSANVTKYGIRVRINALNKKSNPEIREYFLAKGFHSHPVYDDEDIKQTPVFLEGHNLKDSVGKTYPVCDYKGGWGIEHLFYYEQDGNEKGDTVKSFEAIYEQARIFVIEYDVEIEDVKVFAYCYYNGIDETIEF